MDSKKQYKCKECGCKEFISQPNKYDIFENQNGKLVLIDSAITDNKLVLSCRECSEELLFDENDVVF